MSVLETVRVGRSGLGAGDAPGSLGTATGTFERAGLVCESVYIRGGSNKIAQAVSDGVVHFAVHPGAAVARTNAAGGDVVMLASVASRNIHGIITPPEVKRPQDLLGKRLGTRGPGGQEDISLRMACHLWGIDPERDVEIVAFGERDEMLEGVRQREIWAFSATAPWTFLAQEEGLGLLHEFAKDPRPYQLGCVTTSRALIASDPGFVQRYVTALVEAMATFVAEPEAAMEHISAMTTITSRPVLERTYALFREELCTALYPQPEAIGNVIAALLPFDPAVADLDPAALMDTRFLDALQGGLLPLRPAP